MLKIYEKLQSWKIDISQVWKIESSKVEKLKAQVWRIESTLFKKMENSKIYKIESSNLQNFFYQVKVQWWNWKLQICKVLNPKYENFQFIKFWDMNSVNFAAFNFINFERFMLYILAFELSNIQILSFQVYKFWAFNFINFEPSIL